MATMRMLTRSAALRRLANGVALWALAGLAHAQAADEAAPTMAEHAMLEDPLNRALLFEQLEWHDDDLKWDGRFWAGYTFNKLLVRTEGEKQGGTTDDAELELMWSHAFSRWWELVAGARGDFEPGSTRTWAAFGVQGLAPQWFEIEATAYVGEGGETAARFEGEYELLITPRLILQPQLELNWYGQADRVRGTGAGLSTAEAALRLRYEFRREVAPYLGLVRERKFGTTADIARAGGADADDTSLVAGVRLRF